MNLTQIKPNLTGCRGRLVGNASLLPTLRLHYDDHKLREAMIAGEIIEVLSCE